MLQLNLVVVQQPSEELVGRRREAPLVEMHERDDVACRRLRQRLIVGNDPLLRLGEGAQEPLGH